MSDFLIDYSRTLWTANTIIRNKFSVIFLPNEWTEQLNLSGGTLLACLGIMQLVGAFRPTKTVAYVDHLFGMIVGIVSALWWKGNEERKREAQKKNASVDLWGRLLGKK